MTQLAPPERAQFIRRTALGWAAVVLVFVTLSILDERLWAVLRFDPERALERKDYWQVFRQFGALYVWAIIAVCLWLHDARASRSSVHVPDAPRPFAGPAHRAVMVFLGAALGGGLAELLKVLVRRSRPLGDGHYHYGWVEPVHGYGLASSHTGVAFGGAIMLSCFFPALRVPLLLLASATAMTRLAVGAHYTTDVFAAVVLSYAGCALLWKVLGRPRGAVEPAATTPAPPPQTTP